MQVSFLTSVKGTSQFLPEMLDSVKDCGVDYEVQIRANGLPEWDAVKFATDGRPRCHVTRTMGISTLSDSLNDLMMLANAPLVMRLDPDDALPPRVMQWLIQAYRGIKDVVYGNYLDVQFNQRNELVLNRYASARTLWDFPVGPYNFLISRDFGLSVMWKEVGYEDWNMYIRLMAAGGVPKNLDLVALHHRVRPDGRLASFVTAHERRLEAMREDNKEWFNENRHN
ncbi:hypothetical protein KAR91_09710 [Candidatus Pacearchaeota archaeon]|nr:hypothetical protein [Candidatus Pacearchaeota archaeon]